MARLVSSLQSIVRDDGSPDILKRESELDGLITALLPSEIRFLKQRLASRTFVQDFIPDLPVEIHIQITDYLGLSDLISIRNVSRKWCQSWSHIGICNRVMKRFFRSAFENSYMQHPDTGKICTFLAASDRRLAMQLGDYQSMTIRRYDDLLGSEGSTELVPILDRRYRGGRAAWVFGSGIRVTDLRSGASQSFMTPDRSKAEIWNISEKWLLVMADDKLKLYAWPLFSAVQDAHTIRLPSLCTDAIAISNDSVGLVTTKNEVFIWSGQNTSAGRRTLRQFHIKDPLPRNRELRKMAVLFHPDENTTKFIIFLTRSKVYDGAEDKGTVQWTVQKYEDDLLVNTYKLALPLQGLDCESGSEPSEFLWLNPRKIDDSGIYSLGSVPVDFASRSLDLGCCHHWDSQFRSRGHRHIATYITFDIYEGQLNVSFYHLPRVQQDLHHITCMVPHRGGGPLYEGEHVWNGQILLPLINNSDSVLCCDRVHGVPVKGALAVAIKSCDQITDPPTAVRYIAGSGIHKRTWESKSEIATRDLGMAYGWIGNQRMESRPVKAPPTAAGHEYKREIRGDGTFVVLFGDIDYVVWKYDES